MGEDIVSRCRAVESDFGVWLVIRDAADEIERLREQNDYLKANVEMLLAEAKAVRGGK